MSELRVPGRVTVVGGGLAGLVAAIAAAEAGWSVTLHEARSELGGRARTTAGAHKANWGPHAVYNDGALWRFLDERGLARPANIPPLTKPLLFRMDDRLRRVPPLGLMKALMKLRKRSAPVDLSYADWATSVVGPEAAARIATLTGVFTFDADPGRLSARFVHERLARVTAFPTVVRYVPGGWATVVDRLAAYARGLGVTIETDSRVDSLPGAPTVVALPLDRASALLGLTDLQWTGTRTALLDIGLRSHRKDPFIISDLDDPGWVDAYSKGDHTLAPAGEDLVQAQTGLRDGETLESAVARLEHVLDLGYDRWRERETWRRRARIENESGALDLPGTTWRDRPAIDRGDGVYLVGDMVAAPGLLAEVSVASAVEAVELLTQKIPTVVPDRAVTEVAFGA